jgi:hypothetical protein
MEAWTNIMKYTKSALKELIIEVAKEHSLDFGLESAPSPLYEEHDWDTPDEEERREWDEFIERDMLALRATLENAKEALGSLSPDREEIYERIGALVHAQGEEEYDEEEEEIEDW